MNRELLDLLTNHQFYHIWGCVCGWDDEKMQIEHTEHLESVLTFAGYIQTPGEYLINRVEVIDETGRVYIKYPGSNTVTTQRQDDNKTLKIFIS